MRVAVFLLYIILQIAYQAMNEVVDVNPRYWWAFNILTHILFVAYLCHVCGKIKTYFTEEEISLLFYIKLVCIANSAYILYCAYINDYVRIYNDTDLSAVICGIGLLAFIVDSIFKSRKK